MLTITKEQIQIFDEHEIYKFQTELLRRYKIIFPFQYSYLGDKQLFQIIEYGYEKSIKYGFEMKNQIFLYIYMMFKLGSNFDKDIQFGWLSEILKNKKNIDSGKRITQLYESVKKYLSEVSGENDIYFHSALIKLLKEYDLKKTESISSDKEILDNLNYVYPQKYIYFEMDFLKKIIEVFRETAHKYDIQDSKGIAILTLYMLLLGDNFFIDPQFPWAKKVFIHMKQVSLENKIYLLHKEANNNLPDYYSIDINNLDW